MGQKRNLGLLICVMSRQVSNVLVSVSDLSHWCLEFGRVEVLTVRDDGTQTHCSLLVFDTYFSTAIQSFTGFRSAKPAHLVLLKIQKKSASGSEEHLHLKHPNQQEDTSGANALALFLVTVYVIRKETENVMALINSSHSLLKAFLLVLTTFHQ